MNYQISIRNTSRVTLPAGTVFTWVADVVERNGDLMTQRVSSKTRDEALSAAQSSCTTANGRKFISLEENWESAVLPEKYPGQPFNDRIMSWPEYAGEI